MAEPIIEPAADSRPSDPFLLVVGIGASAGGIKALKEFFSRVPEDAGVAYVVILHLSPDHDSKLAEVLQTAARLPVSQVKTTTAIAPDHIYVVPPNKSLEIADGTLMVSEITRPEQRRSPVDVFFRALADSYGSRSVCIVLSGTGPNGSAGLKRVKEYGGLVIVQSPTEAEHGDMPRNAIATGLVDLVLPVEEMPSKIAGYVDQIRREQTEPATTDDSESDAEGDPEAMRELLTVLRVRTGHDFSNYKRATLHRRIERRMTLRSVATLPQYARLMRQSPDEAVLLMKELLISVTNFFRDPSAWAAIEQRIVPRLFTNKAATDQVRVWVPGCATGEEAYSIAILLAEYGAIALDQPTVQVFATDLDERAIAVARDGIYSEADIADVSDERLQRFFHRANHGYRIRRELREMVLFAHHNLLKDPPFSHLDLISCRNLLIYLNRSIQERLIETFHFALRPGGYLFLGTSESPDGAADLFLRIDATAHVYETRTVTSRLAIPVTERSITVPSLPTRLAEPRGAEKISPADLHQRLLEQYAPPSVVVTENHTVIHMSDRAGRYMHLRGGEPSRDLLTLVRPELRPDLRTALHQAMTARAAVEVRNVLVALDDGHHRIDVAVRPVLRDGDPARGFFVVLFSEGAVADRQEAPPVTLDSPAEALTMQLEEELTRLRAQLRQTVDQYETQAEEAKAANEELQAMNEELRSSAEELETSKEELQSVNEELTTVNQELKIKIEELGLTNNDFQNFINATDIGTIFLDRALRVKFSTPRARTVFNLLDSDAGRPLSDITSRIRYDGIYKDVETVLDRLQTIEREVETDDGKWNLMRLLPYRTADNHIDGVVITFQDITERRHAELRVRQSEERLRLLIDGALDYAIFTISETGAIDSWNSGAERMFGYSATEIIGSNFEVLFTPEDRAGGAPARELAEALRSGRAADERYHVRKNGTRFFVSGVTRRLGSGGLGFAKIARDLTAQREAADALEGAHAVLEERVLTRTAQLELEMRSSGAAKEAVTNLLHRVVNAQEDERRRIARDLHDHFGQQLTALRLALERHQSKAGLAADGDVDEALALIGQIGKDVDFLAWELRPSVLDELGLVAALPRFVTEWSLHVGVPAEFHLRGYEAGQLRPTTELAFYRIAQEALNNVAKHAHASRVDVLLAASDGQIVLVVEDDGVGFEIPEPGPDGRGLGLVGMAERAALVGASVQIESTIGKGSSVFVRCPVTGQRARPNNRGGARG
ncbi:MAG TPA: CheR family methyltransferase [Vicinamibacterales bacterium]|nr:CheR family methyltransferase [Vicinamibacterales bacterium]